MGHNCKMSGLFTAVPDIGLPFPDDVAVYHLSAADFGPEKLQTMVSKEDWSTVSLWSSEKRKTEFLLGRIAAKRCLRELGVETKGLLPRGSAGEPLWPEGTRGSITHSDREVVAVATQSHTAIGIDLEALRQPRNPAIAKHVCVEEELEWLETLEEAEQPQALIALFSAKESVYKAYYPICQSFFGFQAVRLTYEPHHQSFKGILLQNLHPLLPKGKQLSIHISHPPQGILSSLLE